MHAYLTSKAEVVRAKLPDKAAVKAYGRGSVAIPDARDDRHWEVYGATLTQFRGDLWLDDDGAKQEDPHAVQP